ncbi:hypothetical protein HERIO_1964 [Hepatospora eriocheir]|uniref:Uncharacterized protein n=1 Tax=Hepatospora eriocheir TaxID=1081669 RepID=A0A1X0Q8F3_9MICR|nr:hypothetical protein HERIO_1964 [Hepatospora eriocheir]
MKKSKNVIENSNEIPEFKTFNTEELEEILKIFSKRVSLKKILTFDHKKVVDKIIPRSLNNKEKEYYENIFKENYSKRTFKPDSKNFNEDLFEVKNNNILSYYELFLIEVFFKECCLKSKKKIYLNDLELAINEFVNYLNNSLKFIKFYHKLKNLIKKIKNKQNEEDDIQESIKDLILTFKNDCNLNEEDQFFIGTSVFFINIHSNKDTMAVLEWARKIVTDKQITEMNYIDSIKNEFPKNKQLFFIGLKKISITYFTHVFKNFSHIELFRSDPLKSFIRKKRSDLKIKYLKGLMDLLPNN